MEQITKEEMKLLRWNGIIETIFSGRVPSYCCWNVKKDIIDVLNIVGSEEEKHPTNLTYLPNRGDMHLIGANTSNE